jgi:hypothetical protein
MLTHTHNGCCSQQQLRKKTTDDDDTCHLPFEKNWSAMQYQFEPHCAV